MNLIQKINTGILIKKANSVYRKKRFTSLKDAHTIGIIFDAEEESNYLDSINFINFLRNDEHKKIKAIGLVNKKNSEHLPMHPGVRYASYSDISLFFKIKNKNLNDFIEKDFDILILLSPKIHNQVKLIVALSNAKLKITHLKEQFLYDFKIELEDNNIKKYTQNIVHYLSAFNS